MSTKISRYEDLESIKKEFTETEKKYKYIVQICYGAGCVSSGAKEFKEAFVQELEKYGLTGQVKINLTGCVGSCDAGPLMIIQPDDVFYCGLKAKDASVIVKRHLIKGIIIEDLCYKDKSTGKYVQKFSDIDFFKRQKKNVLKNCGKINFDSFVEYVANDGYFALAKVLLKTSPDAVIDEIKKSGLRGRGGGGFPTGVKWEAAKKENSDEKYVVCNADEGDPGAFMDRSLIEGDPHLIIEGMEIAGYAIGANKGVVYVRAEYPLAVERLEFAIKQARECGMLGKNILGTKFEFDMEIRIGAGAFVCGEETALL
nr:NAD(P)H-dependent oxidoreductase subunit E [bacterium]